MKTMRSILLLILVNVLVLSVRAESLVTDGEVSITSAELEYLLTKWPEDIVQSGAEDPIARYSAINTLIQNKRIAAAADGIDPLSGDDYWALELLLRSTLRDFMLDRFRRDLEIPDMTEIARERYEAKKRQYAYVPETRLSSHILLLCPKYECGPRAEEMKVIQERLAAGEDFAALANELSEDPGSRNNGGFFDRWIALSDAGIDEKYREALFDIGKNGEVSPVTNSQFGLHIIRLEDARPESYRSFDEVKRAILADLEKEYVQASLKEYQDSMSLSEDAQINEAEIERLFAPYRTDSGE